MADIKSFPNNQDEYIGAEYVMKWLHGRTSGVFGAGSNAAVAALSTPAMAVTVADGVGWMSNAQADGIVWWNENEATTASKLEIPISPADSTLDRITRIIVEWKTTNYVDYPEIKAVDGAASSKPSAPELTNNSTVRQISLAQISVPAGTTEITASMITDERMDASVCGLVTDNVTIDTSMMQSQFKALLEAIQNELANIVGGTGFDPAPIRMENVSVTPDYFNEFSASDDEESKLIEMGYEYRASIPISGVLETMFPYITLSLYDVEESGIGIANQFRCYNGGVYLYSDGVPEVNITILTAEFRKAVS